MLLALAVAAAPVDREAGIESSWRDMSAALEPAGITKPMFRIYSYWAELQSILGYCNARLDPKDVHYWVTWWDDTPMVETAIGRKLLTTGAEVYRQGVADGEKERPSAELCQRTADSWFADMKRVIGEDAQR